MSKIILVAVIVASVNAQFEDNRRFNRDHGNLRVDTDEPRVNLDTENLRVNSRHRHRSPEDVGGFQNGNFASSDGKLKTNLNSGKILSGNNAQNNYQSRDDTYVVEEGAAFRRQVNSQFDVHSSQGRVGGITNLSTENSNFNENERQRPNSERQHNQDSLENNQEINNQGPQGGTNSRQNSQNIDYNAQNGEKNHQNRFNNQNFQQTNRGSNQNERNQSREASIEDKTKPITSIDSKSRTIADRVSQNHPNFDQEAMDREINNKITKMIFGESTEPGSIKNHTKTTQDNELGPRKSSGKQDDRWIWSDGSEMINVTSTTITPTVDDRAAFTADQCPTGKVKFNKVCVDED